MKKIPFVRRMRLDMDLPDEAALWQSLVEICGQNRVLIEHHKGVTEYSAEKIGVAVKKGSVFVMGQQLRLCQMSASTLVISGIIRCVELQREGNI